MAGKDYYKILKIEKNANADEIKKAYRKLAHEFHPDKAGGDTKKHAEHEAKFKEINEAYQVLSSTEKRQQYDQFGTTFEDAQRNGGGGFGGFGGAGGFGQQGGFRMDIDDLEDLFGGAFSGAFGGFGGRGSRTRRGQNIEVAVTLTFEEAVFGASKEIRIQKKIPCPTCKGNGAEPGSKIVECSTCKGKGKITREHRTILGNMETVETCSTCHGQGSKPEKTCTACRGSGVTREVVTIPVAIPAGIEDGQAMQLSGQGEAGEQGTPAGDLFVRVRVTPDKRFERRGDDIWSQITISFPDAALGVKKEIETVDGKVDLSIPEGTQSGEVLRLKAKGVPHVNGRGRGDHHVIIEVKTPTRLSRKQRDLLKDFENS